MVPTHTLSPTKSSICVKEGLDHISIQSNHDRISIQSKQSLQCTIILYVDSTDPGQTVWIHRLICLHSKSLKIYVQQFTQVLYTDNKGPD